MLDHQANFSPRYELRRDGLPPPFVLVPATTTLQASTSSNITSKWAAQWPTTYDFQAHDFASQVLTLPAL